METSAADKARFEELLPFHVNGTLPEGDRQWVAQYLILHDSEKNAFLFEQHLKHVVEQTQSAIPHDQRLQDVLKRSGLTPAKQSWIKRIFGAKGSPGMGFLGPRIAISRPTLAIAAVLFVGQGLYIWSINTEYSRTSKAFSSSDRGVPTECNHAVQLRILFKPDARHADVILALRSIKASVRAGPSETGEFWISLPPNSPADEAKAKIQIISVVDDVTLFQPSKESKGCVAK
jgi:hypothetical protein